MASKTYEELHGSNNWEGLLDPLDPDLRTLILGYGDLCSAAERAFNNDEGSKYARYCRYGKSTFFQGVMLPWAESKYNVASFLYTTAHVDLRLSFLVRLISRTSSEFETNWMGFVAVSNDEFSKSIGRREICVVWRGTSRIYEWINDIKDAGPVAPDPLIASGNDGTCDTDTPKIMDGWLKIYNTSNPDSEVVKTSARTQLLAIIKDLLVKYKGEKISITCTGHSLGASLATISAFDLAANVATPDIMVSAFVFASPQVGNEAFRSKMEELHNLKVISVKNVNDIVPKWPSKIMEWVDYKAKLVTMPKDVMLYVNGGIEILIDSKSSPYLKEIKGGKDMLQHVADFHNLEGMLHIVAGYEGKDRGFDWGSVEKRRCLALANMSGDLLKDEYKIPQSWWGDHKNKGMVLNEIGEWVLSALDRDDHDLPPTGTKI